ncbi:PQQ-dependent dehydrogenase, methanol/ethanol family [Algoriphagus lacus]|uniref:PQQ-dependent dehydrogenase, methanol/ethanol family n=1 Tax=Algoriphagus lacus TaxID=2056311 RepID=A0A418PVN5_9BACT|nr:PQQ-dependent dehydrogenase, methanol/ethanol family [Algoriphagus lacus]RIW18240.1 PQQ-dependent dehydrogenase, methanol/ethanol family [Algoriphagus lacus]
MKKLTYVFLFVFFLVLSCKQEKPKGWIDYDRLANQDSKDWLTLGGNQMMQHFSPLSQINKENVKDLGFAWEYDASTYIGNVPRGLEATPIVVDGIMYTSGPWGAVYALDAKTGKELWTYKPKVDASYGRRACCDVVNRGLAVWEGKVYVGTLDGYLVSLDAENGKEVWRVDTFTDRTKAYTITSPPHVAGNIVMIGNSGGEYGVRGYVTAYDLKSGEEKWRFWIVPGDPAKGHESEEMEMAAKTWDPNSQWPSGMGGTVWGESAYDRELNLLYIGTGNSTPYPIWFRSPAGGDNLFLSSIIAINPDNGKMAWYYQTTPGEIWDYTATQNIVLADLDINGSSRKVLMMAPKNGFYYVLDRATGELISAEKYTKVNWASHVDLKTGRPVLTEQGQWYDKEPKLVVPYLGGGHVWQPMAFNPVTGLVYIPERSVPQVFKTFETYNWLPDVDNTNLDYANMYKFKKNVANQIKSAEDTLRSESLLAYDPVQQKAVWKFTEGGPDGGIMSTPDLVFQGTRTGYLNVHDAKTGEKLKSIFTGVGIMAAPTTYTVDGEQYVSVMAGYGGAETYAYLPDGVVFEYENKGRILTFKLGGGETPLPPKKKPIATPAPPNTVIKTELLQKGATLYDFYCITCHGNFGDNHLSQHPDLSKMTEAKHMTFNEIVLKGILSENGMANFSNSLSEEDVEAIHHYLLNQQTISFEKEKGSKNK